MFSQKQSLTQQVTVQNLHNSQVVIALYFLVSSSFVFCLFSVCFDVLFLRQFTSFSFQSRFARFSLVFIV